MQIPSRALVVIALIALATSRASALTITCVSEFGHSDLQIKYGGWLAVDSQHRLLVSETLVAQGTPNSQIAVFDPNHHFVGRYGTSFFNWGADIASSPNGHTYVYQGDNILDLDPSFASAGTFGSHGFGGGITTDTRSNVYIADGTHYSITRYSPSGQLLLSFTPAAPNDLRHPVSLAVASDGTIVVADTFHDCIKTFDSDGNYLSTINSTVPGIVGGHVHDLVLAPDNTIFALLDGSSSASFLDRGIAAYSPSGELLAYCITADTLSSIALDGAILYGLDTTNATIQVFSIPEPASLTILILPIAALLGRRPRRSQ